MAEIIGVRFNSAGKAYYFDPDGQNLSMGTMVVVETSHGVEMGKVSIPNREVSEKDLKAPLKKIIRVATDDDIKQLNENQVKEKEAFKTASELIIKHKLEMKLIDVEYTFDRSKILFYFTADGRVDFRDLVKSLASVFRTRIELRQIGVRDEARQLGSIGICGRFLCCSTFLDDFRPVSIKMAKEQGLSLNPTKISGVCGRLMCCLQYEEAAYDDALKTMPERGATVETLDGTGTVVDTATLKQQIRVKLDGTEGHKTEVYNVGEFNIVGHEPSVSLDELKSKKEQEVLEKAQRLLEDSERINSIFANEDTEFEKETERENKENQNKNKNNRRRRRPAGQKPAPKNSGNSDSKKPAVKNSGNTEPKNPSLKNSESDNKEGNNKRRYRRPSPKKTGNGGYNNQ